MLTLATIKAYGRTLYEYLRQADYYDQRQQVEGISFGELCEEVGLVAGTPITNQQFEALAQNLHTVTGEQLTERMAAERRAGYDATLSAPKSCSIMALIDDGFLLAHDRAVSATLPVIEQFACQQVGQGINKRYVPTGKIVGAVYRHGESRALDPNIHSHPFIFNITWDEKAGRFVALEASNIFANTKYLSEVYRNNLAIEVRKLGYEIEKTEHGFELVGMPAELLKRFSKRSQERDAAIEAREKKVGRKLTNKEIALLIHKNREKKMYELSSEEIKAGQMAQITSQELAVLQRLKVEASPVSVNQPSLTLAIEQAKEHVFERQAVVDIHSLAAEIIRANYGSFTVSEINAALVHGHHGLVVVGDRVSTHAAIKHERSLIEQINASMGKYTPLGMPVDAALSQEQCAAVQKVLSSSDMAVVLRGKAGTGKTTSVAAMIEGCNASGREVACFAPSTKAVEILRRDGAEQITKGCRAAGEALSNASTIQRLLVDPVMQDKVAGKVLVIDEYGLLSTRDLKRILDLADNRGCRLLLVGDSSQHTSVEASAGARVIERESRITVAEIREIHRQAANPDYLLAAKALATGDTKEALRLLDAMGAVVEIPDVMTRRTQMVDEWFKATYPKNKIKPQSTLMVAPTWEEIHELNTIARTKLRKTGRIQGEDHEFRTLWAKDMTRAQRKNSSNYQPGDVLVVHKKSKQFSKGENLMVIEKNQDWLTVRDGLGQTHSVSPRQTGLSWAVCEERGIPVAEGDRLRLRSVGYCLTDDGKKQRLANGTTLTAAGIDNKGRLLMSDGSVLLSREVVHGYAMTSHASQGVTVDSVFVAGAISKEGLYVSSTRGRKSIRIFTSDRDAFLDASSLRSEDRMSALEFERYAQFQLSHPPKESLSCLERVTSALSQGIGFGRSLAIDCLRALQPWYQRINPRMTLMNRQTFQQASIKQGNI